LLLRKLELYGFKSFADKTEIEFGPGITAIVGPNGSGKSNISDAIRWALGEQSLRSIRGSKAEDIIFAGSAERRGAGVAEVSLVFDNTDGSLPLNFNEVTITRRQFRSGDSEFYINKTPCRLKDIQNLLADVGLGRETLSVVGQNKIDEILNAKPEERRVIFEDVAGITKYKQRKREALRKLEDTDNNLIRINDITSEIKNQLGPLAESAEKTKTYNRLHSELIACQLSLLLQKKAKAKQMVESCSLERLNLTQAEAGVQARIAVIETDKERLIDKLAAIDCQINDAEKAFNELNLEIERVTAKIAINDEKRQQTMAMLNRLKEEQEAINERWQQMRQKQEALLFQMADSEQKLAAETAELNKLSERQQEITARITELENLIASGNETTFGNLQELVAQRNRLRAAERELLVLTGRRQTIEQELAGYCQKLKQTEQELAALTADKSAVDVSLANILARQQQLREEKCIVSSSMADFTARQTDLANKLNEAKTRLRVLTDMQKEYEGFSRGIKAILKSNDNWRHGIFGAVAQLFSVPERYVVAIETALGAALQYLVCKDEAVAKHAIEFLKTNKLGRATFLPLNTVRPYKQKSSERAAATATGVVGLATDLVQCDPRFYGILEYLLGRTIVAEDIDAALRVAKQAGFGVKVVTLDGQLINPGGSITGGSIQKRESSFLSRSHEIAALNEEIEQMEKMLAGVIADGQKQQDLLAAYEQELAELQRQEQLLQVRQAERTVRIEQCITEIDRLKLAVKTVETELAECQQEQVRQQTLIAQLNSELAAVENRDSEHKQQLASWQDELQRLKSTKETVYSQWTEGKIVIKTLQQEIAAAKTALAQLTAEQQAVVAALEHNQAECRKISDLLSQYAAEEQTLKESVTALQTRRTALEQDKQGLFATKLNLLAGNQSLDKELKDLRRKSQQLQNRLHEIELMEAKYSYELEQCKEQLATQFGMTVSQAQALYRDEKPEVLVRTINSLQEEIKALGPVNPNAIEEYERLNERYQFLQQQYNDLVEAKGYLVKIIDEIDQTMSKQFKAAFQAINKHFQAIFGKLFGGGTASLNLLEPENLLDTGIDIVVQPPGKKLQNLTLLSGGERALTVIALLLAFLSYRPTPFCVVDEIDAALDEANVQRFSEFLSEYAAKTQFMVVTHRKGTMEAANVMYGVTMEQSGISKIVSVKFMDKAG